MKVISDDGDFYL